MRPIFVRTWRLAYCALLMLTVACQSGIPGVAGATAAVAPRSQPKVAGPMVSILATSRGSSQRQAIPATFAQPFRPGDVGPGDTLEAITYDGRKLPTQIDWKATHADGSRRHGVITVMLPSMNSGDAVPVGLYRGSSKGANANGVAQPPADLDARIVLTIDGQPYTADFKTLYEKGVDRVWLQGPLVTAWHVSGPVVDQSGRADERLWLQFYVRHYWESGQTRVVTVVENTWTLQPNPSSVTYDVQILVDGREAYARKALTHWSESRWRKAFWTGGDPGAVVSHDPGYLKATGAIPNYDPTLRVSKAAIGELYSRYRASDHEPMGISFVTNPMANGGGRPDIGPLPGWSVIRLLSGDPRMVEVDDGVAATAGSWPVHRRDKRTKRPISLEDYPDLTTHPNLRKLPANPLSEIRSASGSVKSKLQPDISHQPAFAFVPYLLSGDYYFLEEMQFWAANNPLRTTPEYRGRDKGWLRWSEVRGQAWSLRTLGQVAYITPDASPMKGYWQRQIDNNIAWYLDHYISGDAKGNALGFLEDAVIYTDKRGEYRGIAPWQDDFFTWAMGYLVDLGFDKARPMLEYKARFPVGRMTAPGYCWVEGSIYKLFVRETSKSPFYTTFAEAYRASVSSETAASECGSAEMARHIGKQYRAGDMVGYPWSAQGFASNMQPALAASVDAGASGSKRAWELFINRTTKPNYANYPNWAIVPRTNR